MKIVSPTRESEATWNLMKKALILFAVVALGACAVWIFGQETPKPYAYTFNNGIGDCTFTGVSLDQVWAALVKTLMTQDTKDRGSWHRSPADLDRPSGSIKGVWIWPLRGKAWRVEQPIACRLEIIVERRRGGVGVYTSIRGYDSFDDSMLLAQSLTETGKDYTGWILADAGKAFFDKVAELLYGAVEKK